MRAKVAADLLLVSAHACCGTFPGVSCVEALVVLCSRRSSKSGGDSTLHADLLTRLLEADPGKRLSTQGIARHPWFKKDLPHGWATFNARCVAKQVRIWPIAS